jgi:hypothetical protein
MKTWQQYETGDRFKVGEEEFMMCQDYEAGCYMVVSLWNGWLYNFEDFETKYHLKFPS